MKKKVMTKKKIALTASLAGLAVVPAVVTPLVLLTKNKAQVYVENYDEEYGIDQFVYETIEKKFRSGIVSAIQNDPKIPQQLKPIEIQRNEETIEAFRSKLNELVTDEKTKTVAYTVITNAMIDYANNEYGVKLNRETKATFADIDRLYEGIYKSWYVEMKNAGMNDDDIATILNDANENFNETKANLAATYTDALSALIQAKRRMVVIFGAVNKEIGLAAAAQKLQDFMQAFSLKLKEQNEENRIDKLEASTRTDASGKVIKFEAGSDITLWMNDIFTVVDAHTGEPVSEGFTNNILPGYKITPVLHEIKHDVMKNKHSIEIDWQCVKDTFRGQDAIDATAHLFKPEEKSFVKNIQLDKTVNEIFDKDSILTVSYAIPKTDAGVMQDLTTTFPKHNEADANQSVGLMFKWDKDHNLCAFEPFLRGGFDHEDGTYKYLNLTMQELADSGLMFSADNGEHFTRLDAITRSGANTRKIQKEELLDNLPLMERNFTDGCTITGQVALEKNDTGNHYAKVTLHYSYSNAPEQAINIDISSTETSGFQFSRDAFHDMLNEYNKVRMFHKSYKENIFEQDLREMRSEKILQDVVISLTAVFDTMFIIASAMPTKDPIQKKINIAYIVTSAIDLAMEIASYTTFRVCKYDITKDYADGAKKFKGCPEYTALDEMLTTDKERYQLLDSADDGGIDEELFNKMYDEVWSKIPTEEFEVLQSHYSSENENEIVHNYRVATQNQDIDADEYHNKLRGWDKGEKWDILTNALTWGSLAIMIIQMVLGIFDPKIKAAIEAKQPAQQGARAAEQASKNLYQRIIDVFVSLYRKLKSVYQSIKSAIQKKSILKLLQVDADKAIEYIKNEVSMFIRGVKSGEEMDHFPRLFTMKFKNGRIEHGIFEDGASFLRALFNKWPSVNKMSLFEDIPLLDKTFQSAQSQLAFFYDCCRDANLFELSLKNSKAAEEFTKIDDLIEFFGKSIDKYNDFSDFCSAEEFYIGSKLGDAYRSRMFNDLDSESLYRTLSRSLEIMIEGVKDETTTIGWGIYLLKP